jgi:hypothetical protein
MDAILVTVYMIIGVLLRIGIPIGGTFLLANLLRRLDARWREEAKQEQIAIPSMASVWLENPCWTSNECVEETRDNCLAYLQTNSPCWEVFHVNGNLNQKCQECSYLEEIPIPMEVKEPLRRQL